MFGCADKFDLSEYSNNQITEAREKCAFGTMKVLNEKSPLEIEKIICSLKSRKDHCKITPEEVQEFTLRVFNSCVEGVLKSQKPEFEPKKGQFPV